MAADTTSRRRKDWSTIATEVVIVVAGILIAFALDSWWDRRADARREVAHLLALRADFQANAERLRSGVAREERTAGASRNLLRLVRSQPAPPRDSVRNLLGQVFNSGQFEPAMGAYEAIVGAGDFALIRDDTLRRALAEFAATVETRYTERFAEQLYFAFIGDFMGRLRWLDWMGEAELRELGVPTGARRLDFAALVGDPRFEDHLAMRMLSARDVVRQYRELEARAEAILHRIEARLAEVGVRIPEPTPPPD